VLPRGPGGRRPPRAPPLAPEQGADQGRVHQWDGKEWKIISDFYTADRKILDPMVAEYSAKYAAEKKITPRDCSKEK